VAHYREALVLAEKANDAAQVVRILCYLGGSYAAQAGLLDQAKACYRRCLSYRDAVGPHGTFGWALGHLGDIARLEGDVATAIRRYREAVEIRLGADDAWFFSYALSSLAWAALQEGASAAAQRHCRQSLELGLKRRDPIAVAGALCVMAAAVTAQGTPRDAAVLLGISQAVVTVPRAQETNTLYEQDVEATLAALKAQLDESALATALDEGRARVADGWTRAVGQILTEPIA
jgi:tetratricopeptide (TPR) repeat protein